MTNQDFDVAVIGAGPTGAAVVLSLPDGLSVAHLDRGGPEREKLCSGLLTTEAQGSLVRLLGTSELPAGVGAVPDLRFLRFVDFDNRTAMTLEIGYRNMHRGAFDRWLLDVAGERKPETFWGARVLEIERRNGRFEINFTLDGESESITSSFLVDCSGWAALSRKRRGRAPIPRRFAMQAELPVDGGGEFRAFFHKEHTDWFGWTVPKDDGLLVGIGFERIESLPPVEDRQRRDGGAPSENRLRSFAGFLHLLEERGFLNGVGLPGPSDLDSIKQFHREHPVKGSPITTITSIKQIYLGGRGLFVAGEAAGLVSPSSGDGISFGLACGIALGDVFRRIVDDGRSSIISSDYAHYRDILLPEIRELRFNIQKAKMMAHPALRNAAARFLAWHKGQAIERI